MYVCAHFVVFFIFVGLISDFLFVLISEPFFHFCWALFSLFVWALLCRFVHFFVGALFGAFFNILIIFIIKKYATEKSPNRP
jgi:hypothetical protein